MVDASQVFQAIDKNHNGSISREEFLKAYMSEFNNSRPLTPPASITTLPGPGAGQPSYRFNPFASANQGQVLAPAPPQTAPCPQAAGINPFATLAPGQGSLSPVGPPQTAPIAYAAPPVVYAGPPQATPIGPNPFASFSPASLPASPTPQALPLEPVFAAPSPTGVATMPPGAVSMPLTEAAQPPVLSSAVMTPTYMPPATIQTMDPPAGSARFPLLQSMAANALSSPPAVMPYQTMVPQTMAPGAVPMEAPAVATFNPNGSAMMPTNPTILPPPGASSYDSRPMPSMPMEVPTVAPAFGSAVMPQYTMGPGIGMPMEAPTVAPAYGSAMMPPYQAMGPGIGSAVLPPAMMPMPSVAPGVYQSETQHIPDRMPPSTLSPICPRAPPDPNYVPPASDHTPPPPPLNAPDGSAMPCQGTQGNGMNGWHIREKDHIGIIGDHRLATGTNGEEQGAKYDYASIPEAALMAQACKLFDELDRNRDGKLTRVDFERMTPETQRHIAELMRQRGYRDGWNEGNLFQDPEPDCYLM